MKSKKLLICLIVGLAVIVSGCASESANDGEPPNAASVENGDTSQESRTYSVGEAFEVGSLEYEVTEVETRSSVGMSQFTMEEADGIFVLVSLEVLNNGKESLSITNSHLELIDSQGRTYSTDSDTIMAIDDSFIIEQVDPGLSKSGTLAFDVPSDQEGRRLKVSPLDSFSNAEPHYVNLE